jgi:hypothetical protein
MKRIIYIISVVFFLSACSDFLNEESTGVMTTDSKLSSLETATALANNAYVDVSGYYDSPAWGSNALLMLDFITGKTWSSVAHSRFEIYKNLALDSRAYYIDAWWRSSYYGIAKCNLAIQKLPEFTALDQTQIKRIKGEVHFMRAFYYFQLVRIFGDVPKITTVQNSPSELYQERSPLKEIYDEIIIPDLLEAEQAGLPWKDETGRTSLGAVKTLLADVYLTYAGYPVQGGATYYAKAAAAAKDVIDNQVYSLYDSYDDLRNPANNNKKEFIFQMQFSLDKRHNGIVQIAIPPISNISIYNDEMGGFIPTTEFVESYPAGDKRTEDRQFFFSTYPGHPSKFPAGSPELVNMNLGGYFLYKYFDEEAILRTQKPALNWTFYRYADLLLLYAEASNETENGANNLALESVNSVRKRANLPPITDRDKDKFREAVWTERYLELCYENKTWFDMVRTRKVRNDISRQFEDLIGHTTIYGKTFSATHLLFPIPQYELDANRNLKQNPGY